MAESYTYQKKWKEFGRSAAFDDTETKILGMIAPDPNQADEYIARDPNKIVLSNIPQLSTHSVNTERIPTNSRGDTHTQGGWPEDVDPSEDSDKARYIKKMQRDPTLGYAQAAKEMTQQATQVILQNNEIDLFEEYFAGEQAEHLSETMTTKTMMIFKDPSTFKRAATSINWHPDYSELRVGVTYAMLRFQQMPHDMPRESYIWNLNNPNFPEKTLLAPSPLCSLAFNPKNHNIVVGGSYNGSLSFFDLSQGSASGVIRPVRTTLLEKSHHDPVYDVQWSTVGKSGSECFSISTDGRLLWWDYKDAEGVPRDQLILEDKVPHEGEQLKSKVLGGTALEYNSEVGPLKYLVGTEQGYIMQANKKKTIEINMRFGYDQALNADCGRHHGPVYSLWRNPDLPKFFLSVGDWSAKIWSEEVKSPIMQTRYHQAYLTDGCWSKTRPGLFFLTRIDGFLDVWDFYYKQNERAYSQKISDSPLTSIEVHQNMAAIGDAEGTVSIMQLCKPLYEKHANEKEVMQTIFDSEYKREKILDVNKRKELEKKPVKNAKDAEKQLKEEELARRERLDSVEENFFTKVSVNEDIEAIKARGELSKQAAIELEAQANAMASTQKSLGGPAAILEAGKNYKLKIDVFGEIPFVVEAGGIIQGSEINGNVEGKKIFFTFRQCEFEGEFEKPTIATLKYKDNEGKMVTTLAELC